MLTRSVTWPNSRSQNPQSQDAQEHHSDRVYTSHSPINCLGVTVAPIALSVYEKATCRNADFTSYPCYRSYRQAVTLSARNESQLVLAGQSECC